MSAPTTSPAKVPMPSHVPPARVVDFDFMMPGVHEGVHERWLKLREGPDLVWSPYHGGHWIATRAELIEEIQKDGARFSHEIHSLPLGKPVRSPPLQYDPPEHAGYRMVLNPAFAPKAAEPIVEDARALAVELIESLARRGECEFVRDFAHQLPIRVFLRLAGLPLQERDKFLGWAEQAVRAPNIEARRAAYDVVIQYLVGVIAERKAKPGEDLISRVVHATVRGRQMSDQELLGMCVTLFLGGLDTVASMLGFMAWHLARHPEHRRELIEHPELVPYAVEELLRRHGLTSTVRLVTRDMEFHGVQLAKGDLVMVPTLLHGTDERRFERPLEVDFHRPEAQRMGDFHATFGNGPHRCVGANLGRGELRIFLEEWLKRIPDFEVKPGEQVRVEPGSVLAVSYLPLVWTPRGKACVGA